MVSRRKLTGWLFPSARYPERRIDYSGIFGVVEDAAKRAGLKRRVDGQEEAMNGHRLLTVEEFAERLRIKKWTAYKLITKRPGGSRFNQRAFRDNSGWPAILELSEIASDFNRQILQMSRQAVIFRFARRKNYSVRKKL